MEKFFFFGCWNKDPFNCCDIPERNDPTTPLEKEYTDFRQIILNYLSENLDTYNFGIIAGDNIYPHKCKEKTKAKSGKKINKLVKKKNKSKKKKYNKKKTNKKGGGKEKKIIYEYTLNKFKFIPKYNSELYSRVHILLGNHDINKATIQKLNKSKNEIDMATYQQSLISETQNLYLDNINFSSKFANYYFLNTNNSEKLINYLLEQDFDTNKWNILIGHEPLYSYKKEKIKEGSKIKYEGNLQTYKKSVEILSLLERKKLDKVLYLCADTHNFQILSASENGIYSIPIVVSGTGGASPDDFDEEPNIVNENINLQHWNDPYGFCTIEVLDKEINVIYHQFTEVSNKIKKKNYKYTIKEKCLIEENKVIKSVLPKPIKTVPSKFKCSDLITE